ncbi:MAG: niacin transporter [Carnobacterium sp.]|nr:niacin transporter [Carnobacterium sp.]
MPTCQDTCKAHLKLGVVKMKTSKVHKLTIAALLVAVGILIPMISPIKIVLEPASFTLASHVSIFIAMFISPIIAITVALGTAVGFLLGGFPIIITLRALTHVVFAGVGSYILLKKPEILQSAVKTQLFSLFIGFLHAVCEVIVVSAFYFGGEMTTAYYVQGFLQSVFLLVGVGTIIHSMIDFMLAHIVWKALISRKTFAATVAKLK